MDECESRGMTRDEARGEARRRLGDVGAARRAMLREDRRFERSLRMRTTLHSLRDDLRFAVRGFLARPVFTLLTVLTLAAGIATATTFFGAIDSILLQPIALDEPDRVFEVWGVDAELADSRQGLAPANVRDIRERSRAFSAFAAGQPHSFDIVGPAGPMSANAWIVSPDFFAVLATRPFVGRLFGPPDFEPGAEPVVVTTHAFWVSHTGADPAAVGRTVELDGVPHTLVGVLPPDFPVRSRDLLVPRAAGAELWESRTASFFTGFARLASGENAETGRADLDAVAAGLAVDYPEANRGLGLDMEGLRESLVAGAGPGLWLLFAAAILILVVALVNAAGLLLAEAAGRTRELAMRAAVGAGQGRLMRQLLTETALLAAVAALVAVPLATSGLGLFRAFSPPDTPRIDELGLDLRVGAFAVLVTFVSALVVGLVPSLRIARPDLYEILKPGGRSGTLTPATARLRSILVGTEVAIAVILLVGGGLLLRSWVRVQGLEQGYDPRGVEAVEIHFWQFHEDAGGRAQFIADAVRRLEETPGVDRAMAASSLPLAEQIGNEDGEVGLPGDAQRIAARWLTVTPGYFDAMGIEIVEGRPFDATDDLDAERVIVLNSAAALRLFGGESAVDRTLIAGSADAPVEIRVVGVVADVRHTDLETEAEPTIYSAHQQTPAGSMYLAVRTSGAPGLPILRSSLAELQPSLVVSGTVSLEERMRVAGQPRRFSLMLLSGLGAIALLLTVVGLFGHLSHSVRTREHELGVRLALGAWPARLIRAVLGQGLTLVAIGAASGVLLAYGLSRFMTVLLYQVAPSDPLTFVVAALLVMTVGAAACYLPARRVSRVDPAVALRVE